MTKKDYILIADVIKKVAHGLNVSVEQYTITRVIALELSKSLYQDNPALDTDKFISYIYK